MINKNRIQIKKNNNNSMSVLKTSKFQEEDNNSLKIAIAQKKIQQ